MSMSAKQLEKHARRYQKRKYGFDWDEPGKAMVIDMGTNALDKFRTILSTLDKDTLVSLCSALLDAASSTSTENKWEEIARDRDIKYKELKEEAQRDEQRLIDCQKQLVELKQNKSIRCYACGNYLGNNWNMCTGMNQYICYDCYKGSDKPDDS